ncbi:hypothetical protein GCM10009678_89380 [Actinomadura kijaniata]
MLMPPWFQTSRGGTGAIRRNREPGVPPQLGGRVGGRAGGAFRGRRTVAGSGVEPVRFDAGPIIDVDSPS